MSDRARIICDGAVIADEWILVPAVEDAATVARPNGKLIVPLKVWLAQRELLESRAHGTLGVWLDSHEDAATLLGSFERFAVIAINFPKFTDGRGYSIATLIRSRYGFEGELRAIGDVLRDQLFYMHRVGFNAFAVRADKDIEQAVTALSDFSEAYQASTSQPRPLFRRRYAPAAAVR
jgi:uncharacterized protein (DUF934 family)